MNISIGIKKLAPWAFIPLGANNIIDNQNYIIYIIKCQSCFVLCPNVREPSIYFSVRRKLFKSITKQEADILQRSFQASPDLMYPVGTNFLIQFSTDFLTPAAKKTFANLQRCAYLVKNNLISTVTFWYEIYRNKALISPRLVVAEFGTLFIYALDYTGKGAVNG